MRVLPALCLLLAFSVALGKVAKGTIDNSKQKKPSFFAFIDKFCFAIGEGTLTIRTTWSGTEKFTQDIVVFDDEKSSWHSVYKNHIEGNCSDVIARAKYHYQLSNNETKKIDFKDSQSPHWWYFAAVDCASNSLDFSYNMEFLNPGGHWKAQFSHDEQGLGPMYLFFAVVFTIGVIFHIFGVVRFIREGKYHTIIKLLTIALFCELLFCWCAFIHFAVYADNGVGSTGLLVLGQIFDLITQVVLMLIVVLVAQGWAVSAISLSEQKRIVIILGVLLIIYIIMDIWKQAGTNPALHVYMYGTAPGVIILLLRTGTAVYFVISLYRTITGRNEAYAKVTFYTVFGVIFGLWFIALPLFVAFAAAAPSFDRARIVYTVYEVFNFLALAALSYMLLPSQAEKFFVVSDPSPLQIGEEDSTGSTPAAAPPSSPHGYGSL